MSSCQRVLLYLCQLSWDVSLLERRPHFRGCSIQASVELGPEDVSLLETFQRVLCTGFSGVGT